ncbi:MAG: cell wall hydrolase [Rhizobiaceae bacterium]
MRGLLRRATAALLLVLSAAPGAIAMPAGVLDMTASVPRHLAALASGMALTSPAFPTLPPLSEMAAAGERTCLALAIYHEARGENYSGQVAVARVILNRTLSRAYPASICGVVYENAHRGSRCQFSFTCDGRSDLPSHRHSWKASVDVAARMLCRDRCVPQHAARTGARAALRFHRATHYHTVSVAPSWSRKLVPLGRVGEHLFFASDRVWRKAR